MKIAFLLGSADISGGAFVIFEHASRLRSAGHDVVLLSDEPIAESRFAWHPEAALLPRETLKQVAHQQYDVALATRSIVSMAPRVVAFTNARCGRPAAGFAAMATAAAHRSGISASSFISFNFTGRYERPKALQVFAGILGNTIREPPGGRHCKPALEVR